MNISWLRPLPSAIGTSEGSLALLSFEMFVVLSTITTYSS